MFINKAFQFLFCLAVGLGSLALAAGNPSGYHLLNKIPVSGDKGWDYLVVDQGAERLYVSHGDKVDVLDAATDTLKGSVEGLRGVHGIAVAAEAKRGFISDGKAQGVTVFDLDSLKPVSFVATAEGPDAIIYDPASKRVFVFGGKSGTATAIQSGGNKVAGVLDLGGRPEYACADGKGHVFVNLEDKNLLLRIDSRKLKVTARWPLKPGDSPASLAMDVKHNRLFAGCHNQKMIVLNSKNGKVVADLPIGNGVDAGAFDPETGDIFSSCGEGTLSVIHEDAPDKYTLVENVQTQAGSRTMALDLKTHKVYLSSAKFVPAPQPTTDKPHSRPPLVPGTFSVLVFGK